MATITNSIGTASRNYSTIDAWFAALPADIGASGNQYRGELYADSEFTSTTVIGNGGWQLGTVAGGQELILTTAAGQSFRDNVNAQTNALRYNSANGVAITSSIADGSPALYFDPSFGTLSNVQVKCTGTSPALDTVTTNSGDGLIVENCILQCNASPGSGGSVFQSNEGVTLRNSLVISNATGSHSLLGFDSDNKPASAHLRFCTLVNASDVAALANAFVVNGGTVDIQNTAVFGCTALISGGSFSATTCATNVASPPTGFTGSLTYASQFVNTTAAAGDFREQAGANLFNTGTTDATNGANDIVGTARPQSTAYDIGCWELIPGAAGKHMERRRGRGAIDLPFLAIGSIAFLLDRLFRNHAIGRRKFFNPLSW